MLHAFPPSILVNERLLYAKASLHKTFLNKQVSNRLIKSCSVLKYSSLLQSGLGGVLHQHDGRNMDIDE